MIKERLPTKPIECWTKMKELRRKHFLHTWKAQQEGNIVIQGIVEAYLAYFSGLGNFANPSFGPYFTVMMRDWSEGIRVQEAAEAAGYGVDTCSSMRCHLGQMVLGLSFKGPKGEVMRPNLVFQFTECPAISKCAQIFAEHTGVPHYLIDVHHYRKAGAREYLVAQMLEGVEWLEKTTGRQYDDEKLFEATENEWKSRWLCGKVNLLMRHVPAPIDARQIWSLRLPSITMAHHKETVEYFQILYDEVEDRVRNGISARGWETARFSHEGLPPFPYIKLLRYPTEYGAIFVTGDQIARSMTIMRMNEEDGTWSLGPSWEEELQSLGRDRLRTREEAFRVIADQQIWYHERICFPFDKPLFAVKRARDWHCDGAILHMDRGCKGEQCGMLERKLALDDAAIPNTYYEASQGDCRDFNEVQVLDRLDAYFESLGLKKIAVKEGGTEEPE